MSESDAYDQLWEDWGESYSFWHEVIDRTDRQVAWLSEQFDSIGLLPIDVLDVGCGDGAEMKRAREKALTEPRVVANDISTEALEQYKRANETIIEDMHNCRFEDLPGNIHMRFDVVLFSHCLHGADLGTVLENYRPFVKGTGKLLILLESGESTITQIRQQFWSEVHGEPNTENIGEDVESCLEGAGFSFETTPIEYGVDVETLQRIHEKGIEELYVPFGMRTRDIDPQVKKEITMFVEGCITNGKIPQKTLAISAEPVDD